jgi:hypothetical protein
MQFDRTSVVAAIQNGMSVADGFSSDAANLRSIALRLSGDASKIASGTADIWECQARHYARVVNAYRLLLDDLEP